MGLLDSFEKGLERAVNGAFAKTFRSGIQPVDIASALRAELDKKAAIVSRERILAPSTLTVFVSKADDERLQAMGDTLVQELSTLVTKHARSQGYTFSGPLTISLNRDTRLSTGQLRVESKSAAAAQVRWQGVLDINGKRHPIIAARTVIGRGSDADITIPDAGTSRKHVEILWDGERAMVRDLGSTNGTKLGGHKITEAQLPPDSTVSIGRTDIVFRVVAQAAPSRAPEPDDATRAFSLDDSDTWGDHRR